MNCESARLELDAFALGALEPDEARSIAAHIAGCDACSTELERIRDTVDQLALAVPVVHAPAALRAAVMEAIQALPAPIPFRRAPLDRTTDVRASAARPQSSGTRRRSLAPAAVAAVLVITVGALLYRVASLDSRVNRLQKQVAQAQAQAIPPDATNRGAVLLLSSPGTVTSKLWPQQNGPAAWGSVIWNPDQKQCALIARSLAQPPSGFEYRITFTEDGAIWDGGQITVDGNGIGETLVSMARWPVGNGYRIAIALQKGDDAATGTTVLSGSISQSTQ